MEKFGYWLYSLIGFEGCIFECGSWDIFSSDEGGVAVGRLTVFIGAMSCII
jgi:hypothetical protein